MYSLILFIASSNLALPLNPVVVADFDQEKACIEAGNKGLQNAVKNGKKDVFFTCKKKG